MIGAPPRAGRACVRDLFSRLLGVTFLVAFLSLLSQITLLFGARGLLPAGEFLSRVTGRATFIDIPTIFWWTGASDGVLVAAAALGAFASLLLIANVAPRITLALLWALYLSFASVGQDFLSFQWDNLLLESAFFAFLVAPPGLRPGRPHAPHGAAVFLMLWFVFRFHVESGLAKLLTGDPTWRDLTAMATYYETAPLPTWIGWYVHQLPLWAHKACSLFTFVVEIGLPLLFWVPNRRVRGAAFVLLIAMQISIIATANYGFFNYLTMALCLWVLDDGHLAWVGARVPRGVVRALGLAARESALAGGVVGEAPRSPTLVSVAPYVLAALIVPLSIVPFARFFRAPALNAAVEPLRREMSNWRSINAYHLFASMTLVRREPVIEGSNDGETWSAYEFRHKPGDVRRAPPFVAPHQPRVDFQLWFLLLRGKPNAEYFSTLLARMLEDPAAVAPLFAHDPFGGAPPRMLRVASYRYTFTSRAERRATGAWWHRELEGKTPPLTADDVR